MTSDFSVPRWGFEIAPAYSWFDSLSLELGPDVWLVNESPDDEFRHYFWSSPHLNDLDDPQSVANRAYALKALLDGVLFLAYGAEHLPLRFGDLIELSSQRSIGNLVGDVRAEPFSRQFLKAKLPSYPNPSAHFVNRALFQARYDPPSRDVLRLLGVNGLTWVSLYAVLDILKTNGWGSKQIEKLGYAGKSALDRFKWTANNAAESGPFARHGEMGRERPKKPMYLEEACELLMPIVAAFLGERAQGIDVQAKWESLRLSAF